MSSPRTVARWVFDVAVVVALVSAVVMAVSGNWDATIRFGLIAAVMVAVRTSDVPLPFAGAFAVLLLLSTWAAVRHWYRQIDQFDLLVHFLTPGSLAAVVYFALVHQRLLPDVRRQTPRLRSAAPVLWVVLVGTTAAVVWEFYELVMERLSPSSMNVGYTDTVLDLLAAILGSAVAGGLVLAWGRRADTHPQHDGR
ncbi:hypothetical protein [Modestobacter marinus]|uniref:hypothetical protein n=1 Tax=Modestobacter marinus TaxID=477641 RepID=UPI00201A7972|nr:hypothetical protein [Modestobacter marinus]